MMEVEYVDRYSGTGRRPHALTVCRGQCEGMGVYPLRAHDPLPAYFKKYPHMSSLAIARAERDELTDHERAEVKRIQAKEGNADDGYYFVKCEPCSGTGFCRWWETLFRIPGWAAKNIRWHLVDKPRLMRSAG